MQTTLASTNVISMSKDTGRGQGWGKRKGAPAGGKNGDGATTQKREEGGKLGGFDGTCSLFRCLGGFFLDVCKMVELGRIFSLFRNDIYMILTWADACYDSPQGFYSDGWPVYPSRALDPSCLSRTAT